MPLEETSGNCGQFTCKYHGWRYDLDGKLTFVQQEEEFFDLDKSRYGLVGVHCEVWEGLHLRQLRREPEQSVRNSSDRWSRRWRVTVREDDVTVAVPFGVNANWKLYLDAFQEFYHAPVLHGNQTPTTVGGGQKAGFEAPHYRLEGPHRLVSTSGVRAWEMSAEMRKPIEEICQSGLFGPWDKADLARFQGSTRRTVILGPGFVPVLPQTHDPDIEGPAGI